MRTKILPVLAILTLMAAASGCTSMTGRRSPAGTFRSPPGIFNVRAFGATGDGKTLDTPAINRAIDAASRAGGGTVRFPAGTYLCYSIHLKSNVTLNIDAGATILAAAQPKDSSRGYDPPEPLAGEQFEDFGHAHWRNSLIWGEGLENISIVGPGRINGEGLAQGYGLKGTTRPATTQLARNRFGFPSPNDTLIPGVGNKAISLKLCRNVLIRDVSIYHGGHFAILATGVDNLTIDNLKIDTNRDGMDIDCCRNVRISNCSVNSPEDDGICLKSTFGLGFARATENVTISDCQVSGYECGSFLDGTFRRGAKAGAVGRIKFGTESNGGFKNIAISNCVFDYCRGLALETVDGGLLEDVSITNITMRDIVNSPIFLRLGARMRGPADVPVGELRRVLISNVTVYNADPRQGSIISGIPGHDIKDITLSNIHIIYKGGGTKAMAATQPIEKEAGYPEPGMFGDIPAYGFYIRHVKGIRMSDVSVSYVEPDARPAMVFDDVKGIDLHDVQARTEPGTPALRLKNVEDITLHQFRGLTDVHRDKVADEKF